MDKRRRKNSTFRAPVPHKHQAPSLAPLTQGEPTSAIGPLYGLPVTRRVCGQLPATSHLTKALVAGCGLPGISDDTGRPLAYLARRLTWTALCPEAEVFSAEKEAELEVVYKARTHRAGRWLLGKLLLQEARHGHSARHARIAAVALAVLAELDSREARRSAAQASPMTAFAVLTSLQRTTKLPEVVASLVEDVVERRIAEDETLLVRRAERLVQGVGLSRTRPTSSAGPGSNEDETLRRLQAASPGEFVCALPGGRRAVRRLRLSGVRIESNLEARRHDSTIPQIKGGYRLIR